MFVFMYVMCDETDSKSKNSIKSILKYVHVVQKDSFVIFTALRFPYVNPI